jgi:hypothetical protein
MIKFRRSFEICCRKSQLDTIASHLHATAAEMKNDQISQEIWILLPKIAGWGVPGSCRDPSRLQE